MIIASFVDDIWKATSELKIRYTVRAIAEDEKGRLAFLHIVGKDIFGDRDHLESCGGGIEKDETPTEALKREVQEELGYKIKDYYYIGDIIDTYHLLNRKTHSSFYHVYLDTTDQHTSYTEEEKALIKEIVWLNKKTVLSVLENDIRCPIGKLVQQRDAAALRYDYNLRK